MPCTPLPPTGRTPGRCSTKPCTRSTRPTAPPCCSVISRTNPCAKSAKTLGTSDDTAQKRVSRAVERLCEFFAKRGVTIGASGLVVVISANAIQAAPLGLALTISTAVALAGLGIPTAVGSMAVSGIFGTLLPAGRTKFVVGLAATVVVVTAAFLFLRSPPQDPSAVVDPAQPNGPNGEQIQPVAAPAAQDANAAEQESEPDPLKLLRAVAGKPAPSGVVRM